MGVSVDDIDYGDARWRVLNNECEKHLAAGFFAFYRGSRAEMLRQLLNEKSFGNSPRIEMVEQIAQECIYLAYAGPHSTADSWMKAEGRPAGKLSLLWGHKDIAAPEMKLYAEVFGTPDAALSGIIASRFVLSWREQFPIEEAELRSQFKRDWIKYLEIYGPRKIGTIKVGIKGRVPRDSQSGIFDYDFEFHCNACGGYVLTIPDTKQKADKVICKACGKKLCNYGDLMAHLNDLALMDAAENL